MLIRKTVIPSSLEYGSQPVQFFNFALQIYTCMGCKTCLTLIYALRAAK